MHPKASWVEHNGPDDWASIFSFSLLHFFFFGCQRLCAVETLPASDSQLPLAEVQSVPAQSGSGQNVLLPDALRRVRLARSKGATLVTDSRALWKPSAIPSTVKLLGEIGINNKPSELRQPWLVEGRTEIPVSGALIWASLVIDGVDCHYMHLCGGCSACSVCNLPNAICSEPRHLGICCTS